MDKGVVLLSGGMDSVTALYDAVEVLDSVVCMHFVYGQRGQDHELYAAREIARKLDVPIMAQPITMVVHSKLLAGCGPDPVLDGTTHKGLPTTFVPGRNLIMIGYATIMAFALDSNVIVGGWNSIDVDYPDCKSDFLYYAALAACTAIGRPLPYDTRWFLQNTGFLEDSLVIYAPLLYKDKLEIVRFGEQLGVPWEMTRSCYGSAGEPCLMCDSCIKRVKAFVLAGIRDPLVKDDDVWAAFVEEVENEQQSNSEDGDHPGGSVHSMPDGG